MIASNHTINDIYYVGESSYPDSVAFQEKCVEDVLNHGSSKILGYEYDRVLTLGKRIDQEALLNEPALKGFFLHSTDRGGLITLHNRGQLVIYPILPLRQMKLGVRDYLRLLCQTTEKVLQTCYGISSHWDANHPDGVFVGKEKIAFIGIRVDRGVSKHGISINIQNNTSEFRLFTACGQNSLMATSVQTLCPEAKLEGLKPFFLQWCEEFHVQAQGFLNFQCNQTEVLLNQCHSI